MDSFGPDSQYNQMGAYLVKPAVSATTTRPVKRQGGEEFEEGEVEDEEPEPKRIAKR